MNGRSTGGRAVTFAGTPIVMLPERALYVPESESLVIADPHFGKAASFRASFVPLPGGTTSEDLERLSHLIDIWDARRLVVLGDLLHAREGRAERILDAVRRWRERHGDLEVACIRGNHDLRAGDPPPEWDIRVDDPPVKMRHLHLLHDPAHPDEAPALAGHLHPAVDLAGPGRLRERLPCFWLTRSRCVLPAFGTFTGYSAILPAPRDRVYVIADEQVLPIPPREKEGKN